MLRSAPVDGFSLAYRRQGTGQPVVLIHGWPGDHDDWRDVVAALDGGADVVVPDLRGFGESDKHPRDPAEGYSASAQAASVLAPPLPGAGDRVLSETGMREFWYQAFHQLGLIETLIDGRPEAVRAYLEHFWSHWSGPNFTPGAAELDRLTDRYGAPGAFIASVGWYRAGAGTIANSLAERAPSAQDRIAVPTIVLWPEHDPLFPREWDDRLDAFFTDVSVESLSDAGHFSPLEAPERYADAIRRALMR